MDNSLVFSDWLMKELAKREWSQADLARESGLSKQAISNYLNGNRIPDKGAAVRIAKAFMYSPDVLLHAMGLSQLPSDWSPTREQWNQAFDVLDPEEQEEFLAMVQAKINVRKRKAKTSDLQSDDLRPDGAKA